MNKPADAEFCSAPMNLLFVDDEANILKALKRLFHGPDYQIHTAESGAEGLEILERTEIDLIISDMRMPQMDGAEFLSAAARRWPDTLRILLTGFADLQSTVAAVNQGKIYCYCSKPWEDNDLKIRVHNAVEQKRLHDEKQKLFAVINQQNAELARLNAELEEKVEQRNRQLQASMQVQEESHRKLGKQYNDAVKAFAGIIEMRPGIKSGHSAYAAENARQIAQRMGLDQAEIQDIVYAGLLLQIGKMSLPGDLLRQPLLVLSSYDKQRYIRHANEGWNLLCDIERFNHCAEMIRRQYENYDGSGEPSGLKGEAIPIGSRILAVVRDYICYVDGYLSGYTMSTDQVRSRLLLHKHREYDPEVVEIFLALLSENALADKRPILEITPAQLQAGMRVAEITVDGELFLEKTIAGSDDVERVLELMGLGKSVIVRIRV